MFLLLGRVVEIRKMPISIKSMMIFFLGGRKARENVKVKRCEKICEKIKRKCVFFLFFIICFITWFSLEE